MTSSLQRIRELAVKATSGTNTDADRADIQTETKQLVDGIDSMAKDMDMNGVNLINSATPNSNITSLIGTNAGDTIVTPTYNLTAANLKDSSGNTLSDIDLTTTDGANKAIGVIDATIQTINPANSKFGGIENRLSTAIDSSNSLSIQVQSGDSEIMDTNVAAESVRYSTDSIIVQAGIAMMAQTDKMPQDVLNILKNV